MPTRPRKRLGQHFLTSPQIAQRIVEAANLDRDHDVALEIGPGRGELTQHLVRRAKHVIAIEIDPALVDGLQVLRRSCPNLTLIHDDALKMEIPQCTKVISNLPYSISSPVVFKLVEHQSRWEEAVLMFQREFAQRLVAKPGSRMYSRLSAGVQYFFQVEALFSVKRANFSPPPRVDSTVVRFSQLQARTLGEIQSYLATTRGIFPYKNKIARNALYHMMKKQGVSREMLAGTSLLSSYLGRRVRTLSPPEIAEISNILAERGWV